MTNGAVRPLLAGIATSAVTACALIALIAPAAPAAGRASKPGPPSVTTGSVRVQGASATLLGSVNPRTAATTYYFQYGATTAYGKQTTPATLAAGTATVKVGQAAAGLLPGYHYRLVASNSFGPRTGKDRTFSTSKSRRTKFTLDKPKEATVYGGSVTLSGVLTGTGNAGRKIVLQESPYPFLTSFATAGAAITTNAAGAFSFRVARLATSTQYRVSTLDPRPIYSSIATVQAAYRVTLKVKHSSHKGIVRLYGTVSPAAVGARVSFQLSKKTRPGNTEKTEERTTRFATQFTTKVKRGTSTISRFSAIVKVVKGGNYRARVDPVKKGAFVTGQSPAVLLHSAPK
ncbi:MAG TPA: hypothetical protein VL988_06860 [Solirubrobacteraceae bacterium]|nr:hypothetical protein [Solirubrobacteraceae bacterium]